MIGNDTFRNGEVVFRPGPIYQSAVDGGFCILDEINMARNEALAVLHSVLDFRRTIHIPGYDQIPVHPATRFIATMNYGYAGTRDSNEALASRFVILQMPSITQDNLTRLLLREFPGIKKQFAEQFSGLFSDIEKKCESGELTEKSLTCVDCWMLCGLSRMDSPPILHWIWDLPIKLLMRTNKL